MIPVLTAIARYSRLDVKGALLAVQVIANRGAGRAIKDKIMVTTIAEIARATDKAVLKRSRTSRTRGGRIVGADGARLALVVSCNPNSLANAIRLGLKDNI